MTEVITDKEEAEDIRQARLALLKSTKLRGQEQMRSLRFDVNSKDRKKVLTALKMAQIIEGAETYAEAIVVIANEYIKIKKVKMMTDEDAST